MAIKASSRVRLGAYELDFRAGELLRGQTRIVLQEQPLQILLMLVDARGEVVSREEIQKRLWPNDTVVEFDHSIRTAINKLRKALNDSPDRSAYIQTVARRGYRLMVPVESVEDAPSAESGNGSGFRAASVAKAKLEVGNLTGKVVSHYRVLEVIGGGGMGMVYKAEDLKLGRQVALKFLPDEVGEDSKARERFKREAHAVSALDHPNICTVYDFDEHDGHPFIAMQLLHGKTLREHLADGCFRLSERDGLEIAIQIAAGLEAAHEKGIIHRDIKPANIFITEKKVAKIVDFGVAKMVSVFEPSPSAIRSDDRAEEPKAPFSEEDAGMGSLPLAARQQGAPLNTINEMGEGLAGSPKSAPFQNPVPAGFMTSLTRTGVKLGTAGYMSPEQIRGESLDPRTDIFSFGMVLYEMATGERAFAGETEALLHDAIEHHEPKPVCDRAPEISPGLESLISKCLEKVREQRFRNASEVGAALIELQAGSASLGIPQAKRKVTRTLHGRWLAAACVAIALVGIVVGALYRRAHPSPQLKPEDTVVLADIRNVTDDPALNGSLLYPVTVGLGQTPFLNLLSAEKTRRFRMQFGANYTSLTKSQALELCLRSNSRAFACGTIADAGNRYRLELEVVECQTERLMASASGYAEDRGSIVKLLGDLTYSLRSQLGEAKSSLAEFNQPLELATSSSIEALHELYIYDNTNGAENALPHVLRATELDPSFGRAQVMLCATYANLGMVGQRDIDACTRAFNLRGRMIPTQNLSTAALYYGNVTGQSDKEIEVLSELVAKYPRVGGQNNLALTFFAVGRNEEAAEMEREAIRVTPDFYGAYSNLVSIYTALNRPDEAQEVFLGALKTNDSSSLRFSSYRLAFLRGDYRAMQEAVNWGSGKAGVEDVFLAYEADTIAFSGRLKEAREYSKRATRSATGAGFTEVAVNHVIVAALREAEIGNISSAERLSKNIAAAHPADDELTLLALLLARTGHVDQAQKLADDLNRRCPLSTYKQGYALPTIRAAIALQKSDPHGALEALKPALNYEMGRPGTDGGTSPIDFLYPAYMRGQAYLAANQGKQAAAEFQKLIDHPGIVLNCIIGALAHLQLARAQVMMGDKNAARKSYQDFLTLWKDADPDIPIYRQAKAEYAKLQ